MTERYHSKEITEKLASLGCAFRVHPSTPTDPEKFILESLRFYWEYNDIFFMTYSLLKHRLHKFIHVERLVKLAESSNLTSDETVLLIALCKKLAGLGDHRYKSAVKKLQKPGMKMQSPPDSEKEKHLLKTWGNEESLFEFGVTVRSFYEVDPKKFRTLEGILKRHPWLKLRALIGPNFRADVVYLKSSGIASTAYRAAKIAGCDTSNAGRIWNMVEPVHGLEKLIA